MDKLDKYNKEQEKKKLPPLKTGQVVKVSQKIKEKDKFRTQIFEGSIISIKHGKGINAMATVRKESEGIMVEKIFPLHSPLFDFEIVRQEKVRRGKLYYLRNEHKKRKIKEDKKMLEFLKKQKEEEEKEKQAQKEADDKKKIEDQKATEEAEKKQKKEEKPVEASKEPALEDKKEGSKEKDPKKYS